MAKSFNARMKDRFATITSNGDKLNKYIHETAMMIAEHAKEHKDCSTAQQLVMAMPASMRREMLILWFSKFTPIVVKNDDKWAAQMHKPGTKLYVEFDLEAGNETPFYKLAEENKERAPASIEDLEKWLKSLPNKVEKDIEKGKVSDEAVEFAQAVARALASIKVDRPKPANDTAKSDDEAAPKEVAA